jgi:hypothetical protein
MQHWKTTMSDLIIEQLLAACGHTAEAKAAADEIERLRKDRLCRCADEVRCEMRAEIERLRAVVDAAIEVIQDEQVYEGGTTYSLMKMEEALAALETDDE